MFYVDKDKMIYLLVFCCLSVGGCLGLEVRQSLSDLVTKPGDKVQIFCSHDKTDYRMMLWYQRSPGDTAMKLIGYLYNKDVTMEEPYKGQFNIGGDLSGTTAKNGSLTVQISGFEHSAVYYCAAREAGGYNEAYFGAGTKLTVLEVGVQITPPTVKVLPPSPKECRNQKDKLKKKTIVCVASEFYPDHVSVFWQINGVNVSEGVATDNAALRNGKKYTITSRLRVPAKEWYTPGNEFTCIVSFYNGTHTEYKQSSISGDEAPAEENIMTRENYLKITQKAKLSYGVFIVKSCLYGVFVAFLVWKLQGSTGKRNNRAKLT